MPKLEKPTNDWARTLMILHMNYMAGASMAKVLNVLPHFYKFQTRLREIEKEHPNLRVNRVQMPFKNIKLNKSGYFTVYTVLNPNKYLVNLYNKINKHGLKKSTQK